MLFPKKLPQLARCKVSSFQYTYIVIPMFYSERPAHVFQYASMPPETCCLFLQDSVMLPSSARLLRLASDSVQTILNESTKARTRSIQLKGVEYGQELSQQMMKHSQALEKIYGDMHAETSKATPNNDELQEFLDVYEKKHAWFEKAEARVGSYVKK